MYCIECGSQIPENSKFCSHCGHKQTEKEPSLKEKISDVIIENVITKKDNDDINSSKNYKLNKKIIGWYFAWVILNLGFLLIGSDGIFTHPYLTNDFWPFGDSDIGEYDIREFLVYTIFPLALLFIWKLVKKKDSDKIKSKDAKEFFNLGVIRYQNENYNLAIQDFNQAIEIDPNYIEAYNNRGFTKSVLGDYLAAIDDYNIAIEINAYYPNAFYNRGVAKQAIGDIKGAINDWTIASELGMKEADVLIKKYCK